MKNLKIYIDLARKFFFLLENQNLKTFEFIVLFLHSSCWFEIFSNKKFLKNGKNLNNFVLKLKQWIA